MSDADIFKNDFLPLLKAAENAKRGYRDEFMTVRSAQLLQEFAAEFSRKYAPLKARVSKDVYSVPRLHVLIERDFSVLEILEKLISISKVMFENKTVSWSEFKSAPFLKSSLVCSYDFHGARELQLTYHDDGFEVVLDEIDEYSPEYKLCLHYALKDGIDHSINLSRYALTSGRADYSRGDTRGSDNIEF